MMKNRKGSIIISKSILDDPENYKEILAELFSKFYPVVIEHKFDTIVYSGYSDFFDEIEEGISIPFYSAVFGCQDGITKLSITKK